MRLEVGPVEPESAAAWIDWADETSRKLRVWSATGVTLPADVVDDLRLHLARWKRGARSKNDRYRWHGEIDVDQLEYLVHAFVRLDAELSGGFPRSERSPVPVEARDFYLVLVRAILHALELDSPCRAAFADQLRSSWQVAVEGV